MMYLRRASALLPTMRLAAAGAALALLVTGCGVAHAHGSGDGYPSCLDVWQVGATLPADFAGCSIGGGEVEDNMNDCGPGQPYLYEHAERKVTLWALPGTKIQVDAKTSRPVCPT